MQNYNKRERTFMNHYNLSKHIGTNHALISYKIKDLGSDTEEDMRPANIEISNASVFEPVHLQ